MKKLSLLPGFVCLIAMMLPACAPAPEPEPEPAPEPVFDQEAEEAAVRKVDSELTATWNAKDLEAHFALIDENYVLNDRKKGKAAHREFLEKLWSSEDYSQNKSDEIDLVFVTPDVAIYRVHGEDLEPAMKWNAAWLFSKKSRTWLLSAGFWWPIEE